MPSTRQKTKGVTCGLIGSGPWACCEDRVMSQESPPVRSEIETLLAYLDRLRRDARPLRELIDGATHD